MIAVGRFFLFLYFAFIYGNKCSQLPAVCTYRAAICEILLAQSVSARKLHRLADDLFSLGNFRYERYKLRADIAQKAVDRFLRMIAVKVIEHVVCVGDGAAVIDHYNNIIGASAAVFVALHNIAHYNVFCDVTGRYYGLGRFKELKKIIYALIEIFLARYYYDIAVSPVFSLNSECERHIRLERVKIMLIADDPCACRAARSHYSRICPGAIFTEISSELYIFCRQLVLELPVTVSAENIEIIV